MVCINVYSVTPSLYKSSRKEKTTAARALGPSTILFICMVFLFRTVTVDVNGEESRLDLLGRGRGRHSSLNEDLGRILV